MPLIPALGRQRQADFWVRGQPGLQSKFQDSQDYRETLSEKAKKKKKKERKEGKSAYYPSKGPESSFQHPQGGSQLPLKPAPWHLMPLVSEGICTCVHITYTNTHIHKLSKKKNLTFKWKRYSKSNYLFRKK
jgi:hypothetical protein